MPATAATTDVDGRADDQEWEWTVRHERYRRACLGVGALLLGTVVGGCSGPPRQSGPSAQPMPQTLQADSVASEEFGLLAGGGWAQAWDLWADSARQVLTQADFVRLNTECRPVLGTPYVIDSSTKVDSTTVRIDWHRATATGSDTLSYQAGKWRFLPDPASLADYRLGVAKLVERRRAAHACH
ncbi:hypothetical protein [Streptacidiphilus sp. P02-A3a]|uniref:hypothetical protein n=1 Tax=Streptacidiphilus sp. P02-A3a TaxID=2704468 RepID=UPI0015FD8671|nr:hypothetical protein [Streptacidiphilus sp. P02-A3a]QMU71573.1 hypothetical protein GXP74_28395 [Streptacidiphilus sp. P02-A3a]